MPSEVSAAHAGTVQVGDRKVHRMGLGTNRLTDTAAGRTLLQRAVEQGVTFIDTADVYQSGASESTIGRTLGGHPKGVMIATKGGMVRTAGGLGAEGNPDHLRRALAESLHRLGTSCIELYQLHRVDDRVPIETSVGALREMQIAGRIRKIGLSNVTVEEIERARREATIVSVQNRYNLVEREQEGVLDYCEEHGIAFIPYTPLVRGNVAQSKGVSEMAARYGVTPHQLALRWLLMRSPVMLPIPGTLSTAHLQENLAAADIDLSLEDFHLLRQ